MIEYRKSLVTSFFFKFFLSVQKELDQNLIDEADLSGIFSIFDIFNFSNSTQIPI